MVNQIRILLLPFSLIFWIAIRIRHLLFDWGIIKSHEVDTKTICVGNLTVGGTGKTPHVEYLLKLLGDRYRLAMLSRGYRRQTKGFQFVTQHSNSVDVGDEPLQIKNRYPKTIVAVDEKRVRGAQKIMAKHPEIEAIILDDAFQHRYIKPGLSILLIDYSRPVWSDFLLPAGNLRDISREIRRANIVIVTKCPKDIKDSEILAFSKRVEVSSNAKVFFSMYNYGEPIPVFQGNRKNEFQTKKVIGLAGIANPLPFKKHLIDNYNLADFYAFPDHHAFSKKEIWAIFEKFSKKSNEEFCILTTEKDAARIRGIDIGSYNMALRFFYIPIQVGFLNNNKVEFNNIVEEYVRTGKANYRVH